MLNVPTGSEQNIFTQRACADFILVRSNLSCGLSVQRQGAIGSGQNEVKLCGDWLILMYLFSEIHHFLTRHSGFGRKRWHFVAGQKDRRLWVRSYASVSKSKSVIKYCGFSLTQVEFPSTKKKINLANNSLLFQTK